MSDSSKDLKSFNKAKSITEEIWNVFYDRKGFEDFFAGIQEEFIQEMKEEITNIIYQAKSDLYEYPSLTEEEEEEEEAISEEEKQNEQQWNAISRKRIMYMQYEWRENHSQQM
jgi:hypothetical protein